MTTPRAQRLMDEYEIASGTRCHPKGLAAVLRHLDAAWGDPESFYAVPGNLLEAMAKELS